MARLTDKKKKFKAGDKVICIHGYKNTMTGNELVLNKIYTVKHYEWDDVIAVTESKQNGYEYWFKLHSRSQSNYVTKKPKNQPKEG